MEEGEAAGGISGHVCRDAEKEGHGDFSEVKILSLGFGQKDFHKLSQRL